MTVGDQPRDGGGGSSSRAGSPVVSPRPRSEDWSCSDRSSVASRLSHDSGAHSDSAEERKQLAPVVGGVLLHDYDVPPPKDTMLRLANYLVPPAPRYNEYSIRQYSIRRN